MQHMDEGLLQAWLDGPRSGLTEEDRSAVDHHLARCPECAERVAELRESTRRVEHLLAPTGVEEVPAFEAVVTRARSLGAENRRRRLWVRAGWAASVILALGVGWLSNELSRESAGTAASGPRAAETFHPVVGPDSPRPATPIVAEGPLENPDGAVEESVPVAEGSVARTEISRRVGEPVVVQGRVTDAATGDALPGAQVVVEGTHDGTLTRPDGTFTLVLGPRPDSVPANVTLAVGLIGYGREMQALSLPGGDTLSSDFQLTRSAVALEGIVVTAAATPAPQLSTEDGAPAGAALRAPSFDDDPGAWRTLSEEDAAELAAFPIGTIPGLPIVGLHVVIVDGTPVVRVVQALDDTRRLTLLEAARPVTFEDENTEAIASTLVDGEVFVVARAPLPRDSLRTLLSRIR